MSIGFSCRALISHEKLRNDKKSGVQFARKMSQNFAGFCRGKIAEFFNIGVSGLRCYSAVGVV